MTDAEFNAQMQRLVNHFGKKTYSPELLRLLWRELQFFDAPWFARTVDHLIGSCRQPPLLSDFAEHCSRERERKRQLEKEQDRADAKEAWSTLLTNEDIRFICGGIRRRLQGGMSDEECDGFIQVIHRTEQIARENRGRA